MCETLVIVESPAKCKKIESYLGAGYKVIASFGHLRNISGLNSIDTNDNFKVTYSIIQEVVKLKQIEKIRAEILKSIEVIIATDDDREGEAIGWHICELFGLSIINTKRIIFHEISESAIKSAMLNPKRINMNIVNSQQSRQILDLLVGFTISPILWKCVSKTHDTSLSAGRCQTTALRLVYDNYIEIKESPGKTVYNTQGYFTNLNLRFDLNKQFTSNSQVTDFLNQCIGWDFVCNTTAPKKAIKKSPEPLTTSYLQQLASNELHLSPKDTMKCAQQLYEKGYITYMRTDSKKYGKEFIEEVKKYIIKIHGDIYISQMIDHLIVGETNEEAHEAIRPVNINIRVDSLDSALLSKAVKLYDLIWKITLESCMPPAQYNSVNAKIPAPINSEFVYKTEEAIFLGWKIVETDNKKSDNKKTDNKKSVNNFENDNKYQYITSLKKNIQMKPKKIDSKFAINELKSHYTEARLVQLLEENGIGRPSTFASLIDKIQERKYVEKTNIIGKEIECSDFSLVNKNILETVIKREFGNEKNKLVIQPLGIIVIEFLLSKFDSFFNYNYTKEMENNLDSIATGDKELHKLCDVCYKELTNITNELHEANKFSIEIDDEHTLIIGKYGPVIKRIDKLDSKLVTFVHVKKNLDIDSLKHIPNLSLEHVIDINCENKNTDSIGKYRGKDLFVKNGKFGFYAQWGKETKSLGGDFDINSIDNITYIDVIRFLDKDTVLDPSKPVGFVRELNKHLTIRTGKYGDYIFCNKPRAKKPIFLKLKGFPDDYKKCDKNILIDWIKQTYNV